MKCKRPLAHRPEFEGKFHCKHCERESKQEWDWMLIPEGDEEE